MGVAKRREDRKLMMFDEFGIKAVTADELEHGDAIAARILEEIETSGDSRRCFRMKPVLVPERDLNDLNGATPEKLARALLAHSH